MQKVKSKKKYEAPTLMFILLKAEERLLACEKDQKSYTAGSMVKGRVEKIKTKINDKWRKD